MKTFNPSPKKHNCFRCEPKGVFKKADVFIAVDGLLNDEKQPLCYECKKEWEKELAAISASIPLFSSI